MADLDKESTDKTTSSGSTAAKRAAGAMASEVYTDQKSMAKAESGLKKSAANTVESKVTLDKELGVKAPPSANILSAGEQATATKIDSASGKNSNGPAADALVPFEQSSDGVSLTFQASRNASNMRDGVTSVAATSELQTPKSRATFLDANAAMQTVDKATLQTKETGTLEKTAKEFGTESAANFKQHLGGGTKDFITSAERDSSSTSQDVASVGKNLQIQQFKDNSVIDGRESATSSKDLLNISKEALVNAALRTSPQTDNMNALTRDAQPSKEFLNTTVRDTAVSKDFATILESKDNSVVLQKERMVGVSKDFSASSISSSNDYSISIAKQNTGGGIKDFAGQELKEPSYNSEVKEHWGSLKEPMINQKVIENPSAKQLLQTQEDPGKSYSKQVEISDSARVVSTDGRNSADIGRMLSGQDKQNYAVQMDKAPQAISDAGNFQNHIEAKLSTTEYKSQLNLAESLGSPLKSDSMHTLESRSDATSLNASQMVNANQMRSSDFANGVNAIRDDLRNNDMSRFQVDPSNKDRNTIGSGLDPKLGGTDQGIVDRIAKAGTLTDQLKTNLPPESRPGYLIDGGLKTTQNGERDSSIARDLGQLKPEGQSGIDLPNKKNDASSSPAPEGQRGDTARVEPQRTDILHSDSQKTDVPRADAPRPDAPRTDAPRTDAPRTDAPRTDAPRTDAPRTDAPRTDAPRTDAPRTDAPRTDAPRTDAPRTEAPRAEAPRTEPRTEGPRTEPPRAEAPRSEAAHPDQARNEHLNDAARAEAARAEAAHASQIQANRGEPAKAELAKAEPTSGSLLLKGEAVVQRVATSTEAISLKTSAGDQAAAHAAIAANEAGKAVVRIETVTPISDRGIASLNQALARDSQITLNTKTIADFSSIAKVSAELGVAGRTGSPLNSLTSPLASSLNAPLTSLTSPITTNLSASIASAINSPLSTALTSAIASSETASAKGLQLDGRTTAAIDSAAILGAAGRAPLSTVSSAVRGDINLAAGKPGSMLPPGTINGGSGGLRATELGGRTFINGRPFADSSNDRRYLTGAEIGLLIAAVGIAKARMEGKNDKADAKGEKGGLSDIERGLRQFSLADGVRRFPGRELTLSALLALTGASKVRDMDLMLGIKSNNERSLRIERTIGSVKKEKIEMILPEFTIPKEIPADNKEDPEKTDNQLIGLLPAAQSLLRLRKKEADDKEKLRETEPSESTASTKLPVLRFRRIHQVVEGDTLISIAEAKLRDANLAWLIADLNKDRLTERKVDGKRVVEVTLGEKLQLPLAHEIAAFYKRKDREADPDNLITIIVEPEFDKDRIERNLNDVLGVARGAI
jgi:hypothetical protein